MRQAILGALIAAIGAAPALLPSVTAREPRAPAHKEAGSAPTILQLRDAINTRTSYVPSDHLVIDGCALAEVLGSEAAEEARRELDHLPFLGCDETRPDGATVWSLSGTMEWFGGLRSALAVDVRTRRTFHREMYIIEDDRVIEISLGPFGRIEPPLPPPPPRH